MGIRKSILGAAVLFALAFCAFGAANASAAGTTAFTCVKESPGGLFGEHCLTSGSGSAEYRHVAFEGETTSIATNANTAEGTTAASPAILKGTAAGVGVAIKCTTVGGEGPVKNAETAGGEMYVHTEGSFQFTGCEVTSPAGKGCKVNGGAFTTTTLTGTSEGQGDAVKITPKGGTEFGSVKIEGCSIAGLNNTFPISGSLKAEVNGATLTMTHEGSTTQGTLKFAGGKAGLEGAITKKAHAKEGEVTKPLSPTTVP